MMRFDGPTYREMLGSRLIDDALAEISLFGDSKTKLNPIIHAVLHSQPPEQDIINDAMALSQPLPDTLKGLPTTSSKLIELRRFSRDALQPKRAAKDPERRPASIEELSLSLASLNTSGGEPPTNLQLREKLLRTIWSTIGFPKEAQAIIDHTMLFRAIDKYSFDYTHNREVVSDDPWLRDLWDWVAGADEAAYDGGMIYQGMDLSFVGVSSIWFRDLGRPSLRLCLMSRRSIHADNFNSRTLRSLPHDVGWPATRRNDLDTMPAVHQQAQRYTIL